MIVPSSSMSILQPVCSTISRITLPPVPITSRIFSFGTFMMVIRGAVAATSSRAPVIAFDISPRMCIRPSRACASAMRMISGVIEVILMSICSAVMPTSVPATLKSMSPRWSSSPRMSDSTAKPLVLLDQPHGDARHRPLQRHAGVHQRQRAAADRRHRGAAVAISVISETTRSV